MELREAVEYARRVAYRMSKDPEMGSIAGRAGWKAHKTFDATKNVPFKRWIAHVVKKYVWDYWRRGARHPEEQKSDLYWEAVREDVAEPSFEISQESLQILTEYYLERWALDVLAKRRGTSIPCVKRLLELAREELRSAAEGIYGI